ncbi:MAG TPA: hypothetical protein VNS32_11355 [Flavisolibacter sp.]|nr:hypothetical protein [Flavisolibacter sp.]
MKFQKPLSALQFFLLALAIVLLFSRCKKESSGNAALLVTVVFNGKAIPQASVYLQKETLSNPGIPLSEFDQQKRADAQGQAYFENLEPGDYFLYAEGYSSVINARVKGASGITVKKKFRQNQRTITIETQP